MKKVKNDSLQTWQLIFSTPEGFTHHWLRPRKSIVVPASYITDQVSLMAKRRILTVKNI